MPEPGDPSGGVPRATDPSGIVTGSVTQPITQPVTGSVTGPMPGVVTGPMARTRTQSWFGEGGPARRFFTRWGFPLFVLLVIFLGREVLLPFVFAGLIAYILAPVVHWMTDRRDGTRRMPRGLAIICCYLVFISLVVGFLLLLVPRLTGDIHRLSKEAPGAVERINSEWTPVVASWLEKNLGTLIATKPVEDEAAPIVEAPLPAGTAFTATRLPDGRYAMQVTPTGVGVRVMPDGSYRIEAADARPEPATAEDKVRAFVKRSLVGMQSQLQHVVQIGQSLVAGFIRGIFLFFFTLMIGAFILIDMEKVHAFLRSLFPSNVRNDYDVIIAGIDRGLSGVIRGQLLICVLNGVLTYIGLLIFDVKYGLILGVVAGVMSLVPIFGSILSSIPIVIVALTSGTEGIDVFRGVAMTLWIIGIHFIEANLLNPKIIGTAAKIHPVLVIFSLFLGEHAYGLVGALLAVPVLSAVSVVFMYLYRKTWKDAQRTGRGTTGQITAPTMKPSESAPISTVPP